VKNKIIFEEKIQPLCPECIRMVAPEKEAKYKEGIKKLARHPIVAF
jgi:hypothetical protein